MNANFFRVERFGRSGPSGSDRTEFVGKPVNAEDINGLSGSLKEIKAAAHRAPGTANSKLNTVPARNPLKISSFPAT